MTLSRIAVSLWLVLAVAATLGSVASFDRPPPLARVAATRDRTPCEITAREAAPEYDPANPRYRTIGSLRTLLHHSAELDLAADDELLWKPLGVEETLAHDGASARHIWRSLLNRTDSPHDDAFEPLRRERYAEAMAEYPPDSYVELMTGDFSETDALLDRGLAIARARHFERAARDFAAAARCDAFASLPHLLLAIDERTMAQTSLARSEAIVALELDRPAPPGDVFSLSAIDLDAMQLLTRDP